MYFLFLLFSAFLVNFASAADESVELVRILNEVMELKDKYLQIEESMNIRHQILEDKIKSQDEKIQNLEEENTRLKVAIQTQMIDSKKITNLEARISSQGERIRFLEGKLVKQNKTLQLQRRTPVVDTSVAWNNSTKKERGEKIVTHEKRLIDGSPSKRLLATAYPIKDIGNNHAFYAFMSTDMPTPSQHHIFIYDIVVTNVAGNFNHHSGIFTVMESGLYGFSATTISDVSSLTFFEIVKNSSPFAAGFANSNSIGNYHTGTITGIIYAEKGDIVYVRSQIPSSVGAYRQGVVKSQDWGRSSFCGWRI